MRKSNVPVCKTKMTVGQKKRNYDVEYLSSCMTLVQEQIKILESSIPDSVYGLAYALRLMMNTYQTKIGRAESFPVSEDISTRERIFILFRVLGITIQQVSKFDSRGAEWLTYVSRAIAFELAASLQMEISHD